jgi:hypothetical protein
MQIAPGKFARRQAVELQVIVRVDEAGQQSVATERVAAANDTAAMRSATTRRLPITPSPAGSVTRALMNVIPRTWP